LILGEVLYLSFGLHTNRMPLNTLLHLTPNLLFLIAVLNSGCYRLAFSEIMHKSLHYLCLSPGMGRCSRYTDYVTGWTVRRSNPGGGEIFLVRADQPWYPASYTMVPALFPRGKSARVWHRPPAPT